MKRIIVPVDFSEHSEWALEVAAQIAKQQDAEILIVHMLGLSEGILPRNELQSLTEATYYMKLADKRFRDFLDRSYLKGLKVSKMIQNFKVFKEVNKIALEHHADLIVMGSHGTSGLSEIFVGSNTEKVVRNAEVPVLVIKEAMPSFTIKNVVFACNFKTELLPVYHKVHDFFSAFDAQIHMTYINLPGDHFSSTQEINDKLKDFFTHLGKHYPEDTQEVTVINAYTIEQGVFTQAAQLDADLILIPTHGRQGISHFFMGSIGEDVVNHSKKPVITFKI